MAKPKPTSVIRHEIILGKVEREMAEQLVLTQSLKNVVQPIALAGGVVVAYYGIELGARYLLTKWDWLTGPDYVTTANGETIKNPMHGVPVLGGVFGGTWGLIKSVDKSANASEDTWWTRLKSASIF
jgi:hypothetical protein